MVELVLESDLIKNEETYKINKLKKNIVNKSNILLNVLSNNSSNNRLKYKIYYSGIKNNNGGFAEFFIIKLNNKSSYNNSKLGLRLLNKEKKEEEITNSIQVQYNLTKNNQSCQKYICKLFDYGKTYINGKEYFYSLMEKGYDLNYLYEYVKILYKKKYIFYNNEIELKKKFIKLLIDILIQIIKNIRCMHKKNYLHLDIKPSNIILIDGTENDYHIIIDDELLNIKIIKYNLSKYMKVKLIDFGFTEKMTNGKLIKEKEKIGFTDEYFNMSLLNKIYKENGKKVYVFDIFSDLYAVSRMYEEIIIKEELKKYTNKQNKFYNLDKNIASVIDTLNLKNKENFLSLSKNIIIERSQGSKVFPKKANMAEEVKNKNGKVIEIKTKFREDTYKIPLLKNIGVNKDPYDILIKNLKNIKEII